MSALSLSADGQPAILGPYVGVHATFTYMPSRSEHPGLAKQHRPGLGAAAKRLTQEVLAVTPNCPNEENLKHELEKRLEVACSALGVPWTPYQLDRTLIQPQSKAKRFVDAAHGALVIEYEPPSSFRGRSGAVLQHAQGQAHEYAALLSLEEGRAADQYVLVAWDGSHISFGAILGDESRWEPVRSFDEQAARRLLQILQSDGAPLVSPRLLATYFGPEEDSHGGKLVPGFFRAICAAADRGDTKTCLLFNEWRRLFGQAAGVQSERLKDFLKQQGQRHSAKYSAQPDKYLFALNTYIALVAKLVAAFSLPDVGEDLRDGTVAVSERVAQLESGTLFQAAGVSNLLVGDFFSWYRDDVAWTHLEPLVADLMEDLALVNFDPTKRSGDAIRDLFKQMYEAFVPREMRHALGEYYTPDWLAAFVLDRLCWDPEQSLLDPTCGSGTFLLEAIKRRRAAPRFAAADAQTLLAGLHGMDLNPLATLTARASVVTFVGDRLSASRPLRIPVYLVPGQEWPFLIAGGAAQRRRHRPDARAAAIFGTDFCNSDDVRGCRTHWRPPGMFARGGVVESAGC